MFKHLLFIAVLFTGLIACKSKSAANYSQELVALERPFSLIINSAEEKIGEYVAAEKFDSIAITGADLENQVQKKIDEINAIPLPKAKEADNLKAAMLRYFTFIKSLSTGYKNYGLAKTDDERQQIANEQQKLVEEEPSMISGLQSIQKKYAEANGFKVK